ncbi:uncharacterized protein LOC120291296 [Eucalyptus grandis]|uniref:uncharacterized protein LOC120291296 n=1 Tax=Eucalyptus grandis TaxID=71139 RepID=UPI00192EAEBE|nr:uncharacterized protein LOC120291296 [Eucalyptus grandis]XP_039164411.1 uncharacterized protein LOC120291296 [Eucalyptus grandis]
MNALAEDRILGCRSCRKVFGMLPLCDMRTMDYVWSSIIDHCFKASQVVGSSGFSFDLHALILPVESSHAFAQLEFHQEPEKGGIVHEQISFCLDVHVIAEDCSCDQSPFHALSCLSDV